MCGHQETVAAASEGLNIARRAARVSQGQPQPAEDRAHTLVEIDVGVVPPEFPHDRGTRDDFTRTLKQQSKHTEWLGLQLYANTCPTEFSRLKIGFKYAETDEVSIEVLLFDRVPSRRGLTACQVLRDICGGKRHIL